jgi:FHA domain
MATVDVSYVPGSLTAVAGDQCWALVEVSPDSPAVTRIWQQLGQGAAADALLGGLIADGIGGTAGFTLLVAGTGGQHRLFCRGTVGATVVKAAADGGTSPGEGPAAIERIDGAGLLTWREQVVDGADRIFLGEPPADTALRLPATSGVVLAGSVIIDLTNAAARDTVSYEEKPKKKTIVFFPDTITMTHPGSLADRASAASLAAGQHPPDDRGTVPLPAPLMPFAAPGASGPDHSDGRTGKDGEHEFPWGKPAKTVADGPIRPVSDGARPGGPRPGGPMTGPVLPPTPMPAQATNPPGGMPPGGVPPGGMPPGPAGGLIDAPPWLSGPGGSAPAGQAPLGQAPPGPVPAGAGPAEPPYQPPAPRAASRPGESASTVKRAELPDFVAVTAPPDRIGPVVPALLCPSGHVNPPSGATCRRCGAPLPHDPVPVPRPVLGVLRLSLGDVIMLDRGVLMGRNPRTDFAGTDGEERPHVVKLPSADGDISRTHLRVTLDGWHVLVTDLNSTNGTLVTLPGRDPQQLRPGEPVPIQPGTVVTLADGIDFRYEVTE